MARDVNVKRRDASHFGDPRMGSGNRSAKRGRRGGPGAGTREGPRKQCGTPLLGPGL